MHGAGWRGWWRDGPEAAAWVVTSRRGSAARRGGGGGNGDILVVWARSGSDSGGGGDGSWTPSPTFREQPLEREENSFLFSNEG